MNAIFKLNQVLTFPTLHIRYFSVSSTLYISYDNDEDKYQVNGEQLTVSQIRTVQPENRTKAHWLVLIDWELQRSKPYVIVDPFDPSGIIYLTEQQYLVQARTLGKLDAPFTIIARPGSIKPVPIKTPPLSYRLYSTKCYHHLTWKDFRNLRSQISRQVQWGPNGTVVVDDSNIVPLIYLWARNLLHYEGIRHPQDKYYFQFRKFALYLQNLLRVHGADFTILRLKTMLFALYSKIGGNSLSTTEGLNHRVRLRNGLPSFLEENVRKSLRSGSLSRIRIWASMFNIYKYLKGTHPLPPLETIEALGFDGDLTGWKEFTQGENGFWPLMKKTLPKKQHKLLSFKYQSSYGLFIPSAGANHSKAMASLFWDAIAWSNRDRNFPLEWFKLHGDQYCSALLEGAIEDGNIFKVTYEWFRPFLLPKSESLYSLFFKILRHLFDLKRLPEIMELLVPDQEGFSERLEVYLKSIKPLNIARKDIGIKTLKPNELHAELLSILKLDKENLKDKGKDEHTNMTQIEDPWCTYRALFARMNASDWPSHIPFYPPTVGRLYPLEEAAGKVRVVAICDYFTQLALHPVHKAIFDLLKHIKEDATFDQEGRTAAFAAKGFKDLWSYDLKSATDLIPKELYRELLVRYFGSEETSALWLSILSDRDFSLKDIYGLDGDGKVKFTRYSRGQPMGAYSSWAGLALVHHALVQYSASLAGFTSWFEDYLVLGDDIVIANKEVSESYLKVCNQFGIIVGLAKSFISHNGLFNFAAQTYKGLDNISAVSLREELVSDSFARRLEFSRRMDRRWGLMAPADSEGSFRRLVPFSQWQELSSAITGGGDGRLVSILSFYLRNPFRNSEELHIGKIAYWLGFLSPVFRHLPQDVLDRFESCLIDIMFQDLVKKVSHYRQLSQYLRASLKDLFFKGAPGRVTCWNYVCEVIELRFKRDLEGRIARIQRFIDQHYVDKHLHSLPSLNALHLINEEFNELPSIRKEDCTAKALRSHGVFSFLERAEARIQLSKRVKLPTQGWLSKFAPTRPKEVLSAPLGALALAALQVVGEVLPLQRLVDRGPTQSWIGKYRTALSCLVGRGVQLRGRRDRLPRRTRHPWIFPVDSASQDEALSQVQRRRPRYVISWEAPAGTQVRSSQSNAKG